jgi:3-methyl-2-oxobutanoate hydroxymethyltransferase
MNENRVTVDAVARMKANGEKICMLTAYDFPTASFLDQAGIDIVLVGDSLGMVVLGYENTLKVTMEEMLHHCKAVSRGVNRAFTVADMPFLSYTTPQQALENAGRFIQEADMNSVKIEGGREMAPCVERIVSAGIPVMGHIGYTPQHSLKFGKQIVQGREEEKAKKLIDDAVALEQAGAFSIVLECVPRALALKITQSVGVPTIGIGSGPDCGGQVLVTNDLLGLYEKILPGFVKKYADIGSDMKNAFAQYIEDVRSGTFPTDEHTLA